MVEMARMCGVCGVEVALKFAVRCVLSAPAMLSSRKPQPEDVEMGEGSFSVHLQSGVPFRIRSALAASGIRETCVRHPYLRGGLSRVADADVVLDLGLNMGNLTNMAFALEGGVRVVPVESSRAVHQVFSRPVGSN